MPPPVREHVANWLWMFIDQLPRPAITKDFFSPKVVLISLPEVLKCIRTGDSASLAKAIIGGASSGMGTMDQSLAELVQAGLVDVEVAAERAVDPNELRYLTSGPT